MSIKETGSNNAESKVLLAGTVKQEREKIEKSIIDARKKIKDNLGKLKKLYEMPVIWERFRIYDKNRNKGLSTGEIAKMSDDDAGSLFSYAVEDGKISFNDALDILLKFPADRIGKILSKMLGGYAELQKVYFNEIVKRDFNKAVKIVMSVKEKKSDVMELGFSAYGLMLELPKNSWDKIIKNVKAKDSKYAKAIEEQKELFERAERDWPRNRHHRIEPNINGYPD